MSSFRRMIDASKVSHCLIHNKSEDIRTKHSKVVWILITNLEELYRTEMQLCPPFSVCLSWAMEGWEKNSMRNPNN